MRRIKGEPIGYILIVIFKDMSVGHERYLDANSARVAYRTYRKLNQIIAGHLYTLGEEIKL